MMVLVFTMADVRELRPERGRGAEGRVRERPLLSLIYILRIRSLLERRERFGGDSSLPHNKKTERQGLGQNLSKTSTKATSSEEATSTWIDSYGGTSTCYWYVLSRYPGSLKNLPGSTG